MNDSKNTQIKDWDYLCIVCGQSVNHGGGPLHMNPDPLHYLKLCRGNEWKPQVSHPGTTLE
jgi:hypothetical protein